MEKFLMEVSGVNEEEGLGVGGGEKEGLQIWLGLHFLWGFWRLKEVIVKFFVILFIMGFFEESYGMDWLK